MGILKVERIGGFAGFGGPNLRSDGEIDLARLTPRDRRIAEKLLVNGESVRDMPMDGFRFRLTGPDGKVVEVPETAVPQALRDCVQDRLT